MGKMAGTLLLTAVFPSKPAVYSLLFTGYSPSYEVFFADTSSLWE